MSPGDYIGSSEEEPSISSPDRSLVFTTQLSMPRLDAEDPIAFSAAIQKQVRVL